MMTSMNVIAAEAPLSSAGSAQLILAAVLAIATVVLLIVWAKFHPLLGLILGTAVLAAVAAVPPDEALASFILGVGTTFGGVGLLIALGAMLGKLLADSGGANRIVDTIVDRVGPSRLPWAMAGIAAIIGLPMFFEIGVVILVPIVVLVARKTGVSLMLVGIPALAGLSILHGLVPPHPGPVTAIEFLNADLGYTLLFGLIVAVPTLIISGPLLARVIDKWVPVHATQAAVAAVPAGGGSGSGYGDADVEDDREHDAESRGTLAGLDDEQGHRAPGVTRSPSFTAAIMSIVLPVLLMLVRALGELTLDEDGDPQGSGLRRPADGGAPRRRAGRDVRGRARIRHEPGPGQRLARLGAPGRRVHHADRRSGRRLQDGPVGLGGRPGHRRRRRGRTSRCCSSAG